MSSRRVSDLLLKLISATLQAVAQHPPVVTARYFCLAAWRSVGLNHRRRRLHGRLRVSCSRGRKPSPASLAGERPSASAADAGNCGRWAHFLRCLRPIWETCRSRVVVGGLCQPLPRMSQDYRWSNCRIQQGELWRLNAIYTACN